MTLAQMTVRTKNDVAWCTT